MEPGPGAIRESVFPKGVSNTVKEGKNRMDTETCRLDREGKENRMDTESCRTILRQRRLRRSSHFLFPALLFIFQPGLCLGLLKNL